MTREQVFEYMIKGWFMSGTDPKKQTPFALIDPRQKGTHTRLLVEASIVRGLLADGSIEEEPPIEGNEARIFRASRLARDQVQLAP